MYGFINTMKPGIRTLGVSKGMVLVVDPEWFSSMEEEVKKGDKTLRGSALREAADIMRASCLMHEIMHFVRGLPRIDALVSSGADPHIVNMAFDIPINDDLKEAGWTLPTWAVYSSTFGFKRGLTGEQYYELLTKQQQKQSGGKRSSNSDHAGTGKHSSSPDGGDGDSGGENPASSAGSSSPGSGGGAGNARIKGVQPGVGSGHCGGCAGTPLDGEQEADAIDGRTEADTDRIRRQAINDMREAESRGRGTIPSSLQELLTFEKAEPKVHWRHRLNRVIRKVTGRIVSGQADYSMRRPSKRSLTRGVIRPSLIERKPVVAMVEDSSGSMGAKQLKSAREEACGVFKQLGVSTAWFLDADAAVSTPPQLISMKDLAMLPVTGRGGTDFRPAIELAQTLIPKPDILIYFTDGDGTAPETPPKGMSIVWCVVPSQYQRAPAEWGELIFVSEEAA